MYSSSGDGSKFNPYLIEYKTISICSKNQIGVLINGTSQFFILQNITVVQCKSNVDLDTAGFYLFNVSNGLIRNCNGTLLNYSFELNNS